MNRRGVVVTVTVAVVVALVTAPVAPATATVADGTSAGAPVVHSGDDPMPARGTDAGGSNVTVTAEAAGDGERPVEVVVVFEDDAARVRALSAGVVSAHGAVTGGRDVSLVPMVSARVAPAAIPVLEAHPLIDTVERDVVVRSAAQSTPWGVDRLNARVAAASAGSATGDVDVAVLDSGVDPNHPDLDVAWGINTTKTAPGSQPGNWTDLSGHGTKAAGIVAADDDGDGVVGVAPGVDLYAIKVVNKSGSGLSSDLVEGIDRAIRGPDDTLGTADDADVVTMSLSLKSKTTRALTREVQAANASGTVIVASAGNVGDGRASTDEVGYPARYDEVIGVGATDRSDEVASFSSDGPQVELAAPGVNVETTNTTVNSPDAYGFFAGTSAAAPHVAGAAALVLAANGSVADGDLTPAEAALARRILADTARDVGPSGRDEFTGHGVVDANAAVDAANDTGGPIAVPPDGSLSPPAGDERTTTDHALTFDVTGVSADGNTDSVFVSLPATSAFEQGSIAVSVTDGSGSSVGVTNSPDQNVDGVRGGSNNRVKVDVSPDRSAETIDTTFRVNFSATHGGVDADRTGPIRVEARDSDGGDTATTDVASLTVVNTTPGVGVATGSLAPASVNNSTTRTHSLTFDVTGLSADGSRDDLRVTVPVPQGGSLQSGSFVARDSTGTDVTASSGVADGNLTGRINPDGGGTERVTVNATFTAEYPAVDGAAGGPVSATVIDSDGRVTTGEVATLTVLNQSSPFPQGVPGSPTDRPPTNVDADPALEDITGDGTFDFQDVISLIFGLDQLAGADLTQAQVTALDHDGDGTVSFTDVIDLVFQV
jgi:subtilisin family serine protease